MAHKSILFFFILIAVCKIKTSQERGIKPAKSTEYINELMLYMFDNAHEQEYTQKTITTDTGVEFVFGSGLFCKDAHRAEEFQDYPQIQLFSHHFSNKSEDERCWEYFLNRRIAIRLERALSKGLSACFYDMQKDINYTILAVKRMCGKNLLIEADKGRRKK